MFITKFSYDFFTFYMKLIEEHHTNANGKSMFLIFIMAFSPHVQSSLIVITVYHQSSDIITVITFSYCLSYITIIAITFHHQISHIIITAIIFCQSSHIINIFTFSFQTTQSIPVNSFCYQSSDFTITAITFDHQTSHIFITVITFYHQTPHNQYYQDKVLHYHYCR